MKIVIIGSGNVATHLSLALSLNGNEILQVYSRKEENARLLAERLNCAFTIHTEEIIPDADAYIFSIKDDALRLMAESINVSGKAIFIHTAGSVPMHIFEGITTRFGVLYPMQTFSKSRNIEFSTVPCFIEASDAETLSIISSLAKSISNKVQECDSEKRRKMHLAAVFACNLTNHCYRLAERITEAEGIDFGMFLPLIEETASKVKELSPREAQTGPMVRYDTTVMNRQMQLITDERTRQIYQLMADSIHEDMKK